MNITTALARILSPSIACRAISLLLLVDSAGLLCAQDGAAPKGNREKLMSVPNVIDKLLAAEQVLSTPLSWTTRQSWNAGYKELYRQFHKDFIPADLEKRGRPVMAMALGVKASDGVLALQARDKEALDKCADQIEAIAKKLGVPGEALGRAGLVKQHAAKNQWIEAFMYLGYLQQSVMNDLEKYPEKKDDALLIIMGSWIQGGEVMTNLILRAHSTKSSNILREPKMIDLMMSQLNDMKNEEYKKDPIVKAIQDILPEVRKKLNVDLYAPIPKEDVQWLQTQFQGLVGKIVGGAGSATAPAPATTPATAPKTEAPVAPPKAP